MDIYPDYVFKWNILKLSVFLIQVSVFFFIFLSVESIGKYNYFSVNDIEFLVNKVIPVGKKVISCQ